MIEFRVTMGDLERLRFAYSPLAEAVESLYLISTGRITGIFRRWFASVRDDLTTVDLPLLTTAVPAKGLIADRLFGGVIDTNTTMEAQLQVLTEVPADDLRDEYAMIWPEGAPAPLRQLLDRDDAGHRLAEALWTYWSVAIAPYWRRIRSVLDADLAHRAGRITAGGIGNLLSDLHPEVSLRGDLLRIDKRRHTENRELTGGGLLLIPCTFAWPNLVVSLGNDGPPSLTYGPLGVGTIWEGQGGQDSDDDVLGELMGRTRASILSAVEMPRSTTELAVELGSSPPSVNAHLSVLRRSGLVISWRSGRRVLYQRTPLATSIIAATDPDAGTATSGAGRVP